MALLHSSFKPNISHERTAIEPLNDVPSFSSQRALVLSSMNGLTLNNTYILDAPQLVSHALDPSESRMTLTKCVTRASVRSEPRYELHQSYGINHHSTSNESYPAAVLPNLAPIFAREDDAAAKILLDLRETERAASLIVDLRNSEGGLRNTAMQTATLERGKGEETQDGSDVESSSIDEEELDGRARKRRCIYWNNQLLLQSQSPPIISSSVVHNRGSFSSGPLPALHPSPNYRRTFDSAQNEIARIRGINTYDEWERAEYPMQAAILRHRFLQSTSACNCDFCPRLFPSYTVSSAAMENKEDDADSSQLATDESRPTTSTSYSTVIEGSSPYQASLDSRVDWMLRGSAILIPEISTRTYPVDNTPRPVSLKARSLDPVDQDEQYAREIQRQENENQPRRCKKKPDGTSRTPSHDSCRNPRSATKTSSLNGNRQTEKKQVEYESEGEIEEDDSDDVGEKGDEDFQAPGVRRQKTAALKRTQSYAPVDLNRRGGRSSGRGNNTKTQDEYTQ